MTLVRWNPWREIEDMFDRYTKAVGWPQGGSQEMVSGDWAPRVDIAENPESFVIKAEIPEVKKEDVQVTLENGLLTIRGQRKQETETKDTKIHRIERHYGSFMRTFTLPENVDESKINASFKDGMLIVNLGKSEKASPKSIAINVD